MFHEEVRAGQREWMWDILGGVCPDEVPVDGGGVSKSGAYRDYSDVGASKLPPGLDHFFNTRAPGGVYGGATHSNLGGTRVRTDLPGFSLYGDGVLMVMHRLILVEILVKASIRMGLVGLVRMTFLVVFTPGVVVRATEMA